MRFSQSVDYLPLLLLILAVFEMCYVLFAIFFPIGCRPSKSKDNNVFLIHFYIFKRVFMKLVMKHRGSL